MELLKIQSRFDNVEEVNSVDSIASHTPDSSHYRLLRTSVCGRRCDDGVGDRYRNLALVVDGPTLQYALNPTLKPLFQNIACRCRAVMCCRATPLQKVRQVVWRVCTHGIHVQ